MKTAAMTIALVAALLLSATSIASGASSAGARPAVHAPQPRISVHGDPRLRVQPLPRIWVRPFPRLFGRTAF